MKRAELKRKTPLARGTSQLRRTSIKPKSNRKWENVGILDAYREAFPECELQKLLARHGLKYPSGPCQVHHIQWGHSRRKNEWTNLISLSQAAHDWVHKFPADGRILCLFAKLKKNELDWQKLDELYRGKSLRSMSYRSYLETLKPRNAFVFSYHTALCGQEEG